MRSRREGREKSYFFNDIVNEPQFEVFDIRLVRLHEEGKDVFEKIRRNVAANYMLGDAVSLTRLQCKSLVWRFFSFIRFYWKFILAVILCTHALSHIRSNYSEDSTITI